MGQKNNSRNYNYAEIGSILPKGTLALIAVFVITYESSLVLTMYMNPNLGALKFLPLNFGILVISVVGLATLYKIPKYAPYILIASFMMLFVDSLNTLLIVFVFSPYMVQVYFIISEIGAMIIVMFGTHAIIDAILLPKTKKKLHKTNTNPSSGDDSPLQHSDTPYAVELIDVVKIYKVGPIEVPALNGVNLKIKKGEFVAIMGPSGSGKSTLLNLIGALDRPTAGKVIVDGVDISRLNKNELARLRNEKIGFVFQAFNLINRSSVLRNVELPAIIKGTPKKERQRKAIELLRTLGLEGTENRNPRFLSGGQQQRVAIARALINNPKIILADEPTGNLDSKSGREVMNYLRMMNERFGTTVIVVTHDREIAEMADRIVHIRDGKIVKEEVLRNDGRENS